MKKILVVFTMMILSINVMVSAASREHTVERGETLASIARLYNVTTEALIEANPIAKDMLYAGMVLVIPEVESNKKILNAETDLQSVAEDQTDTNQSSHFVMPDNWTTYSRKKTVEFGVGIQGEVGASTFAWDGGDVNGTLSYGGNIFLDFAFNNRAAFIPRNWYMDINLGYLSKGASEFEMPYLQAQLCPLGYRIPISSYDLVVKGGVEIDYPLSDFDSRWLADIQIGACLGVKFEFGRFGVGCIMSYDFTEVSSSCGEKLNNMAVLGTISFKFAKF